MLALAAGFTTVSRGEDGTSASTTSSTVSISQAKFDRELSAPTNRVSLHDSSRFDRESIPHAVVHSNGTTLRTQGSVAGLADKLVYDSPLGTQIASISANFQVADDIALGVAQGAELSRYQFWVTGQANPNQAGGTPYTIDFALHAHCPGAGGAIIPGTSGSLVVSDPAEIDSLMMVEFVADPGVILPGQSVWFSFKPSRSNVGILAGGPASTGFSDDVLHIPGFACSANFGGYPEQAYANFNLQVYATTDSADAFVAYRSVFAAGAGIQTGGGSTRLADDIELNVDECNMVGYEIGVRNFGFYQYDIRRSVGSFPANIPIDGTSQSAFNNTTTGFFLAREVLDPPVPITNPNLWLTMKVNNPAGGWVLTGSDATVGSTLSSYARQATDLSDWTIQPFAPNLPQDHVGFYAVVYCEGKPPVGACCDMVNTDESNDSVCRDVPRMNCGWPIRGTDLGPAWRQGVSCFVCNGGDNAGESCRSDDDCSGGGTCEDNDAFFPRTCGQAACCEPEGGCTNLTENECDAVEPVQLSRLWQRGRFCATQGQRCPSPACLAREGSCTEPRPRVCSGGTDAGEECSSDGECSGGDDGFCILNKFVCNGGARAGRFCESDRDCLEAFCDFQRGCEDPLCCTDVCSIDSFCCTDEWDEICAQRAVEICTSAPEFDRCAPGDRFDGARSLELGGFFTRRINANAVADPFEPGFCCHTGPVRRCQGGANEGDPCASQADCDGFCPAANPTPGAKGAVQVWFKVTIPEAQSPEDPDTLSVRFSTCSSNSPAIDSILQVYESVDPNVGACDDLGNCADGSLCRISAQACADGSVCTFTRVSCDVSNNECPLDADCIFDVRSACESLEVIGCNDDAGVECSSRPRNSILCLDELERGRTYFIMLGVKEDGEDTAYGDYRLDLIPVGACPQPSPPQDPDVDPAYPDNDFCRNSADIAPEEFVDGFASIEYDLRRATFDCPGPAGAGCSLPSSRNDIWYRYIPEASGTISVDTCNVPERDPKLPELPTPDTELAIYRGCDCPTVSATTLVIPPRAPAACDGTGDQQGCLVAGEITDFDVTAGECYLIRLGDNQGDDAQGLLEITFTEADCNGSGIPDNCDVSCGEPDGPCDLPGCGMSADCDNDGIPDECDTELNCCPVGPLTWLDPPLDVVDARYPHSPPDPNVKFGIDTVVVVGPSGANADCWCLNESAFDGAPNDIIDVTENAGEYTITFARPITAGACTALIYTDDMGGMQATQLRSNPANVDGNTASGAPDITALIDIINGTGTALYGNYSADIDRNGGVGAPDITALIDLLNGASQFDPWLSAPLPVCDTTTCQ